MSKKPEMLHDVESPNGVNMTSVISELGVQDDAVSCVDSEQHSSMSDLSMIDFLHPYASERSFPQDETFNLDADSDSGLFDLHHDYDEMEANGLTF
jgi:hypothetical protein